MTPEETKELADKEVEMFLKPIVCECGNCTSDHFWKNERSAIQFAIIKVKGIIEATRNLYEGTRPAIEYEFTSTGAKYIAILKELESR